MQTSCIALSMTEQSKQRASNRAERVTFELIRAYGIVNIIESEERDSTVVFDDNFKVLVYKGNELKKTLTNGFEYYSYLRSKQTFILKRAQPTTVPMSSWKGSAETSSSSSKAASRS